MTTATDPKCDAVQMVSKVHCELPANHERSHIHFGSTGTTAWGYGYAQATREDSK